MKEDWNHGVNFEDYKTENLVRIAADFRYAKYHPEINAILRNREGHLHLDTGIKVLTEVAKGGEATNYKVFFESCVGGDVLWNHTKMFKIAQFLGEILKYCGEHNLPMLSALVVNIQTGKCGQGFFNELVKLGLVSSHDDPDEVEERERERCWVWAPKL